MVRPSSPATLTHTPPYAFHPLWFFVDHRSHQRKRRRPSCQCDGAEYLRAAELAIGHIEDGARNRIPDQEPESREGETHTHPCPDQAQVRGEKDDDGRGKRHNGAGEEAVEHTENPHSGRVLDAEPCEGEHGSDERTWHDGVERARSIGYQTRNDAAEDGARVEHGQQVEGDVVGKAGDAVA